MERESMSNVAQETKQAWRETLTQSSLFQGLSALVLEKIAVRMKARELSPGELLFEQGEKGNTLYLIHQGTLVVKRRDHKGAVKVLSTLSPGQITGEFQVLLGGARTASVEAKGDAVVLMWTTADISAFSAQHPEIIHRLTKVVHQRLKREQIKSAIATLFGEEGVKHIEAIEEHLTWLEVPKGEYLMKLGDVPDRLYLICSGRMLALSRDANGAPLIGGEMGVGDTIGELGFFTGEKRIADVLALRHSACVYFTQESYRTLLQEHPQFTFPVTKALIRQMRHFVHSEKKLSPVQTIALVATGPKVDLSALSTTLVEALSTYGPCAHLDATRVDQALAQPGLAHSSSNHPFSIRLQNWLDDCINRHRFVVFQADPSEAKSLWTLRCLDFADHVIWVADADGDPTPTRLELSWSQMHPYQRRGLLLLHPQERKMPQHTIRWLEPRQMIRHFHARLGRQQDMERLARFLSGHAVGVVLGGGGAKGFAHIGAMKAIQEAGLPVDYIGGTSMGAILGAQYALEATEEEILERCHQGLIKAKPFKAYTLPLLSFISHRRIESTLHTIYEDLQIEDLWLGFFAVSSNLSNHRLQVHQYGSVAKALRASSALPGIVPPALDKGEVLLDGAVLNNLPGDIMRRFCTRVAALDVAQETSMALTLSKTPSPYQWLSARLRKLKEISAFPDILSVIFGALLLASEAHTKQVRESVDTYIHLPTDSFGLLNFNALGPLVEVGYAHMKSCLEKEPLPKAWQVSYPESES